MHADNELFETSLRNAIEQGQDLQDAVRQLTLQKLSAHSLDLESLRQIVTAVVHSAITVVEKDINLSVAQAQSASTQLKQAITGLNIALAQFSSVSGLAIEEAKGRAQHYTREDLMRARNDLECIEAMFIEVLQSAASGARRATAEIVNDLAEHFRIQGSTLRTRTGESLEMIIQQLGAAGHTQAITSLHLAQASVDLLRQIAAGVLTGVADHVKPEHAREK